LTVLVYATTTLAASLGLQMASFIAFSWAERPVAATIGLLGGNRNMAVVWANLGTAATPELMLFFALMQLPIYALPILLAPLYRRIAGIGRLTAAPATGTSQGP
jgi:BASS family bile acid:Na+ symporter